jgi:Protein-L-isoaspartate(D-aspartate) O-methyltransferase (PCMT)
MKKTGAGGQGSGVREWYAALRRFRFINATGAQRRSFPRPLAPGSRPLLLFFLLVLPLAAQDTKLAPYYPTPETVVEKMLELGGLKAGEKMYDLGSGDGRIVIMAAQKFHADAVGVELDKDLCRQSMERIRKLGLERSAHIINGDLLTQNYSSADLVTVYLLPDSINNKVQPLLDRQLKKGARVVAHDFEFKNWTPEKVENIPDDGEGRSHALFLYRK